MKKSNSWRKAASHLTSIKLHAAIADAVYYNFILANSVPQSGPSGRSTSQGLDMDCQFTSSSPHPSRSSIFRESPGTTGCRASDATLAVSMATWMMHRTTSPLLGSADLASSHGRCDCTNELARYRHDMVASRARLAA